jgi:hypothetical protein
MRIAMKIFFLLMVWIGMTAGIRAQADLGGTNVVGHVLNAVDGVPVGRALVNLNSRMVLTDSTGKFEFPAFVPNAPQTNSPNAPQAYIKVSKPGYSSALDAVESMGQQPVADLTKPLEIRIYPNALITGVVLGSDRQPLAKAQLSIYRELGDEAHRGLMPVGSAQTNSRGEYRFDEGGGQYALMVRYSPRTGETGEAVLPERFPESNGSGASTFKVNPGEDKKIDLQVRTGVAYPMTFQAQGDSEGARNLRVTVKTGRGVSFIAFAMPSRTPGEFRLDLPAGSYELHAVEQNRERRMEAYGHVTVVNKPVTGLVLHLSDVPAIPIQVIVDTTANSTTGNSTITTNSTATVPTPQTLNLYLRDLDDGGDGGSGDVRVTALPDKTFAMMAGAGLYRLASQSGGQWFVERATYGSTDLLKSNLTVAVGSGTDTIRVVVSNATGQVTGTVRQRGAPARGFVYLVPHDPGLTPVFTTQIANDGTYQSRVPPGSYMVVAFDHRFPGDLKDPEVAGKLAGGGSTQVTAGAKASLDLELQRVEAIR